MNNFGKFLTPVELAKKDEKFQGRKRGLKFWEKLARMKPSKCMSCLVENIWKYAETGLCFSCTTGEADASDDCEIEELWR